MKLIVGLGNPGERYRNTFHNLGFLVVERLAQAYNLRFKKRAYLEIVEFRIGKEKIILVKPLTFINLSGKAVSEIMRKRRLKEKDLLVVCDDFSLPLGKLRIKPKGSDGGHLGLKSIIENLNTQDFARLRIGIAKPGIEDISEYVLQKFSSQDLEAINEIILLAKDALLVIIEEGLDKAMQKFN